MSAFNTHVEFEVEVAYSYYKGCRGAYEPGGLQIEPDEPENVEITGVTINGVDVQECLSKAQVERLESECMDDVRERMEDAAESAAEMRRDR